MHEGKDDEDFTGDNLNKLVHERKTKAWVSKNEVKLLDKYVFRQKCLFIRERTRLCIFVPSFLLFFSRSSPFFPNLDLHFDIFTHFARYECQTNMPKKKTR